MRQIPVILIKLEAQYSFGRNIMRGLAKYSDQKGPWTLFPLALHEATPGGLRYEQDLKEGTPEIKRNAAGIIMTDATENIKMLKVDIPKILVVGFLRQDPHCPSIYIPPKPVVEMAVDHFTEKGFLNYAFCGFDTWWSDSRGEYFASLLKKRGFKTNIYKAKQTINEGKWDIEVAGLVEWLNTLPKPTALLAANDIRATHIVHACKVAGISIPEEVALLGVDNDELLCKLSQPQISSINIDTVSAGYKAGEIMDKMIRGKPLKKSDMLIKGLPTHIETRHSTDLVAISDKDVAAGIKYIHANVEEPIQVDDVVASTSVCRRILEQRFSNITGRTIFSEIKRARIERIQCLLRETNLTVTQIAKKMSFNQIANLPRYFKDETGLTPTEYREKVSNIRKRSQ